MAMAADLTEAAHLSDNQCGILWAANTLKTKFGLFISAVSPHFDDQEPNGRPVGNWLVPMKALHSTMPAGTLPLEQLNSTASMLFRQCILAASLQTQGLITNAQATALLNAWNAQIGT